MELAEEMEEEEMEEVVEVVEEEKYHLDSEVSGGLVLRVQQ